MTRTDRLLKFRFRFVGTGTLSFDDFCTLAAKFMTEEEEDSEAIKTELREAFRLYDKEGAKRTAYTILHYTGGHNGQFIWKYHNILVYLNTNNFYSGNGYITTEVLREILSELDNNMSDEELDQMIDEIDADGSGTVDFDGKSNFSNK